MFPYIKSLNKIFLLFLLSCCFSLTACSVLKKPKQWFEKEEDPREPTKLVKLEAEKVNVKSVWRNSVGDLEDVFNLIRPYVTDKHVYIVDAKGRVEAWQRADGRRLWSVSLKESISGGVNGGEGIIAIGTENGYVIGLNITDGGEKWRTSISSEVMAISEAKYGVIVVRANDSTVHAIDTTSGNVAWKASRNTPALTLRGASEPKVVGDTVIVGFDDGKLVALSMRDGGVLWEATVSVPSGRSELDRVSDIDGEIVSLDGVVYAVSFNGRVVAIDMDTGKNIWTKDLSSYAGLEADEKLVYVTDADDSVWAFDKTTGATIWRQDKLLYRKLTAPKVMGDYVVVGDFKGYMHWLSKDNGKLVGRDDVAGDAIEATPIVKNDLAYVLSKNGSLAVLQYR